MTEDATTEPTRKVATERARPSLWAQTSREDQPHPTWWHSLNLTTWTGFLGVGASALHPGVSTYLWGVPVAVVAGTMIGAGSVDTQDDPTMDRYLHWGGALGAVTALGVEAWCAVSDHVGLYGDLGQPGPWLGLAAGGTLFGAAYTALRFRLAAARNPKSSVRQELRKKLNGGTWQRIFQAAGHGDVEIVSHEETWCGYTLLIRLDPAKSTAAMVLAGKAKLTAHAAKILRDQDGVTLAPDALTLNETTDALVASVTVQLRDVLTSTIEPFTDPRADDDVMRVGRWKTGDPIEAPTSGPHGIAVGASGSGKSTYEHTLTAEWAGMPHVVHWAAGISKFSGWLEPWLKPVVDGRAQRAVLDMIGGGASGTDDEYTSAVRVLICAHTLMQLRMATPPAELPRRDGNVVISADYPRVIVALDEVDVLIKRRDEKGAKIAHRMPIGPPLTVADMLTNIASKGRSEGVEFELACQKLIDRFLGMEVSILLTNTQRRAVFYTDSAYDARLALKDDKLDASKLRDNSMYMTLKGDAGKMVAGKAVFHTRERIEAVAIGAATENTCGTLNDREAKALGALYADRWNPAVIASIVTYMGGHLGALTKGKPVPAAAATAPKVGDETKATRKYSPGSGMAGFHEALARAKDLADRVRRDAKDTAKDTAKDDAPAAYPEKVPTGDPAGLLDVFDAIRELPEIDDAARNTGQSPTALTESARDRIVAVVRAAGGAPVARAAILVAMPDVREQTVSNRLTALVQAGVLARTEAGYTLADDH